MKEINIEAKSPSDIEFILENELHKTMLKKMNMQNDVDHDRYCDIMAKLDEILHRIEQVENKLNLIFGNEIRVNGQWVSLNFNG